MQGLWVMGKEVQWVKDDSGLSLKDIEAKHPYKLQAHNFQSLKKLPWPKCQHCGLLKLRNRFTDWCVRMGCNASDHSGYQQQRLSSGKAG